jgi:AcrR family transcriptional regulator
MDHWSKGIGCMALARFHKLPHTRRAELLGVAAEAFAEGGYDGTSFNKLIARLGLSKSQAYYYFADKADLFATACARCYEDFYAEVATLPLPTSAEAFWAYVLELNRVGFGFYKRHPMAARLARAQAGSAQREDLARAGLAQAGSTQTRYREWVELGQHLGAVREDLPKEFVVSLSVQLMASSDVWFSERAEAATAGDIEEFARAMTDLSWRMFHPAGAPPVALGAAARTQPGRARSTDARKARRRASK